MSPHSPTAGNPIVTTGHSGREDLKELPDKSGGQDSTFGSMLEVQEEGVLATSGSEPIVVQNENQEPEIDNQARDDTDSAFGDDLDARTAYTASVTSSILNYEYENRRRYHAFRAGEYVIPNDEKEQDRLDLMHHIFNMTLEGKLYLAPVGDNPQRVLDVGTGTGIWAIDFAEVPPNLKFEIDDCEAVWTFPESKPFDFIKMRAMGGSIANWSAILEQAYAHLAPGGWIELTDFDAWASTDDDSLPKDSFYHEFQTSLEEAATKFGKRMNVGPGHKANLESVGFVDVVEDCRKVPLSPWSSDPKMKELGRYMQAQMLDAVESYGLAPLTRVLGWSMERTQTVIAGARMDLRNLKYHMYSNCHSVYGRKPTN